MSKNILRKILEYRFKAVIDDLRKDFPEKEVEMKKIELDYQNFKDFTNPLLFMTDEQDDFCKKTKEKLKNEFESLKKVTGNNYTDDLRKKFKEQFGELTFKEAFILFYYNHNQPRCCFCGSILPISIKRNRIKNEKKYQYTDVEYIKGQVEHIFPQSKFPQFILNIDNWAPICEMCNVVKNNNFFDTKSDLDEAMIQLGINKNKIHPLKLYNCVSLDSELNIKLKQNEQSKGYQLFEFYNLNKRAETIVNKCYDILFNIIKHSDIRSPESLERLLENIASSNWHEINDGYSLNNSPQIWQEFIENILYDECKLMALWDEVKELNRLQYARF